MTRQWTKEKERLWVVESDMGGNWSPTVGVALFRDDGRLELASWKSRNPDDKFRLVKYVAAASKRRRK